MLSYLLIAFAAVLNAVMDRLDNPYTPHIFPKTGGFWNKGTSNKVLGYYFDAWHLCKTLLLVCLLTVLLIPDPEIGFWWNALAYTLSWAVPFNICYHILFIKK